MEYTDPESGKRYGQIAAPCGDCASCKVADVDDCEACNKCIADNDKMLCQKLFLLESGCYPMIWQEVT